MPSFGEYYILVTDRNLEWAALVTKKPLWEVRKIYEITHAKGLVCTMIGRVPIEDVEIYLKG